jgi:hypothetical protein
MKTKIAISCCFLAAMFASCSVLTVEINKDLDIQRKQGQCIGGFIADGVERSDIIVLTSAPFCEIK